MLNLSELLGTFHTDAFKVKYFDTTLNDWREPFKDLLKPNDGIVNGTYSVAELKKKINSLGLTFHHSQDLKNMILVPMEVHDILKHLGGSGIATKIQKMAVKEARRLGYQNNEATINKIYQEIESYYKETIKTII